MPIYTKTGDQGQTSHLDKTRTSKNSRKLTAIGTLDELNTALGLAISLLDNTSLQQIMELVQKDIFQIGSYLSGAQDVGITHARVLILEGQIDDWENKLPTLTNFVLPGGSPVAATIHLARSIARRAEREVVAYHEQHPIDPIILQYINRLSDWLFVLARYSNLLQGASEKLWTGNGQA